jgi:AP2-like factor, euAP2 lineage
LHSKYPCPIRGKKTGKSSQFRGVHRVVRSGKYIYWQAGLHRNGRLYSIGTFKDELDAARAYDVKARELDGPAAILNFP